jgi:cytosine/adenosine deaminase-related metal-dependent hydrolase
MAKTRASPSVTDVGVEGEGNLAIDWKESLYLATRGGSVSLGLKSGLFDVGAPFDAQMGKTHSLK